MASEKGDHETSPTDVPSEAPVADVSRESPAEPMGQPETPASVATPAHAETLAHPEGPQATAHEIARRQLLGRMSLGIGAVCGAAISAPGLGFVVAPLFRSSPREWRPVGRVSQFKVGATVSVVFEDASPLRWAGVTARTAAWLRRVADEEFIAFSVNCAHLGCPVRWLDQARLFMCPCHGGVYYEDGSVAAGPPPHPLTRYAVRVTAGNVEIRTDPIPIG
jgi:menaquinol-cytochrome c reductase iron-sulfur subunit